MPPIVITKLTEELGEDDVHRVSRIIEMFSWDVPSLLDSNNKQFIDVMRNEYSMNTRRMYCTKFTRIFQSNTMKGLYTNNEKYEDAMYKWKITRRAINAEASTKATVAPIQLEPLIGDGNVDLYKDVFLLTESALQMIESGNTTGAIRFLLQKYIEARKSSGTSLESSVYIDPAYQQSVPSVQLAPLFLSP